MTKQIKHHRFMRSNRYKKRGSSYKAGSKKEIVETVKRFRESNIPSNVIDEMQNIKITNQYSDRPESLGEWIQAKSYGDYYYRMLKKYPELRKFGYSEDDIVFYDGDL